MEASHKTHRPHIKVGKDEEKKKKDTTYSDTTPVKRVSPVEDTTLTPHQSNGYHR